MSDKKRYRSSEWYNSKTHKRDTFVHRGWMRNQGHPSHLFDGRPVIGICNGFQILVETGLVPGVLLRNKYLEFICKNIFVKIK